MIGMRWLPLLMVACVVPPEEQAQIRLLIRSDDMGATHSINEGCIRSCREGIARSVEVIVPGPWFPEAVQMLKDNPGIDVGVHLALTSEWDLCKWRPLTHAPSLVDEDGYFYPMTGKRKDFPADRSFLEAKPKLEEVERELRAQIELAKKRLPNLTHLSAHMGTARSRPDLRDLTNRLAKEYGIPIEYPDLKRFRPWKAKPETYKEREDAFVAALRQLGPGTWLYVEHPAPDSPEMRRIFHPGYEDVAVDRDMVLRLFISSRVLRVIRERGIELITYADLNR